MELITGLFAAFGLSASAGLNAYIPLLVIALLARFTEWVNLSAPWDTLESPWIIGILVTLSAVEFFVDKIPAVNHANDLVQTLVRPVAGAIAFAAGAGVISDVHPVLAMGLGLTVAGGVHAAKSLVLRPAITATTAGAGNVPISILEDVISTVVSILSILLPVLAIAAGVLLILLIAWWFWRRSRKSLLA